MSMMADKNNKRDDSPEVDTRKEYKLHSYSIDFNLQAVDISGIVS